MKKYFQLLFLLLIHTASFSQSLRQLIQTDLTSICSHRGVSALGKEENSIQSMSEALSQGIKIHEIDIMESIDGKLYLLHDETLDRTTDLKGYIKDTHSKELDQGVLKGTKEPIPAFKAALQWAKENGAYLMLDVKAAPVKKVMEEVQSMNMMDRVMLLTFTRDRTDEALAYPEKFLISALIKEITDIDYYLKIFHNTDFLIGYINKTADAEIYQQARKAGVTILTDTMGEVDKLAKEDGGKSYVDFIYEKKPDVLVSDYPLKVKKAVEMQF
ncbi:glycerophosphodiester phosphodiesterase family protein [Anditalea andensis]|uniref:GP-PDE domain-containing protein n=1 Tax=Anditalea andensis TaxID=1048983 RepID=A0A074KZF9_9BACT|nr:glycerophosphodiester phosphodiesterase family protein [Anditalea andensis]KEO73003.1 hypothetical protein EL17_15435 [Anditalea andensis]